MKVVNFAQRDDEWFEWRRGGITATDAIILLDKSPYKTRWRLWAEKTGYAKEVDLSMNPLVRNGVENEDLARREFEKVINDILLPACVQSSSNPLLRASLDGLSSDRKPAELKCPSETVWNDVCFNGTNSKAYQLYYPQVQHQLLVTGAQEGWLVFYFNGEIKYFLIARDDIMIGDIIAAAGVFWAQVKGKKEPEKDPEKDLYIPKGVEINQWIFAAEEYKAFDAEAQELKKRLAEIQKLQETHLDTMKSLMGGFYHADYCGVMVTRYKAAGRVDYKKLLSDKAQGISDDDIDSYREKSSERCRVTVSDSVMPRTIVEEEVIRPLNNISVTESLYF